MNETMKLEDQQKCISCEYSTENKKSFSNHIRFGCNAGKNYQKLHYENNKKFCLEKSKKRYSLKKDEINKKRKLRYALNPEKEKETIKKYVASEKGKAMRKAIWHRYRTQKMKGEVTTEQLEELFKSQSTCKNCNSYDHLEIDHIIPLSKGGYHIIDNLQLLCRKCNRSKGNKIWN